MTRQGGPYPFQETARAYGLCIRVKSNLVSQIIYPEPPWPSKFKAVFTDVFACDRIEMPD